MSTTICKATNFVRSIRKRGARSECSIELGVIHSETDGRKLRIYLDRHKDGQQLVVEIDGGEVVSFLSQIDRIQDSIKRWHGEFGVHGVGFGGLLRRLRVARGLTPIDIWDRLGSRPAWSAAAIEEAEGDSECRFTEASSLRLVEVLRAVVPLTSAEAREWAALTGVQLSIVIVHACSGAGVKRGE